MRKLNKIIKSSEFDKMQKLEKKVDFKEAIIDPITKQKKQFFNLGPKNNYKSILSKEIRDKICSCADAPHNFGYDVKNKVFGDMYKMGVIDPAKVTKNALKNAVSVATTILSTNAIVTMKRK